MPVPAHGLSVWEGVFGSTNAPLERWSFSIKSAPGPSLTDTQMDSVAAALTTCWNGNLMAFHPSEVILTRTRHVQVGADGKYLTRGDGSYVQGVNESVWAGTATVQTRFPLQSAHAVSLQSARSGPTGKGRFFLPQLALTLGADYRIPESDRDSLANAIREFLRDVNSAVGPVVVASSKGYLSPVVAVRFGRVVDTIRSRRDDQIEALEPLTL